MIRFLTILMLLIPALSYGAASIVPAFGTLSSATGGKVSAGQTGTNTLNVVGGTVSKIAGKPTLTIPTLPSAGVTAVSAIAGASSGMPLADSYFGYLDGATYKKIMYTDLQEAIRFSIYDVEYYDNLASAIATIGNTPATLQYRADQTVTDNLVIPATLELRPLNNAIINHGPFTISGPGLANNARWPAAQIFNGSGAVTGMAYAKPVWFGPLTQASINKALAAAVNVDCGSATYSLTGSVVPVARNVLHGQGAVFQTSATSNFKMVSVTADDVEVYGIHFVGTATTDTSAPVVGIDAFQSNRGHFHHNIFEGLNINVYVRGTDASTFSTANKIHDNRHLNAIGDVNGGYGVLSTFNTDISVTQETMSPGPFGRHTLYISEGSTRGVWAENVTRGSKKAPLSIYSLHADSAITDNVISNNILVGPGTFAADGHGMAINGFVYDNIFSANQIVNSANIGLMMQSTGANGISAGLPATDAVPHANKFVGTLIKGAKGESISITDGYDNDLSATTIQAGGGAANTVLIGAVNTASANGNVLDGIRVTDTTGTPAQYSINLGVGTSGNVVRGHMLRGATVAQILDSGNNSIAQSNYGTQTVAYAATVTVDPTLGEVVNITLTGPITINLVTAKKVKGQRLTLKITQDGTGGWAVTLSSAFKPNWSNTGNTAGKVQSASFICEDGINFVQVGAATGWYTP